MHLSEVVVECVEQVKQQFLGVLLGIVVELWEDGAEHRPGLHRSTAGAAPHPHLLQQAHKHLGHTALRPARAEENTTVNPQVRQKEEGGGGGSGGWCYLSSSLRVS